MWISMFCNLHCMVVIVCGNIILYLTPPHSASCSFVCVHISKCLVGRGKAPPVQVAATVAAWLQVMCVCYIVTKRKTPSLQVAGNSCALQVQVGLSATWFCYLHCAVHLYTVPLTFCKLYVNCTIALLLLRRSVLGHSFQNGTNKSI